MAESDSVTRPPAGPQDGASPGVAPSDVAAPSLAGASAAAEGELRRQLASLTFSEVEPTGSTEAIQAVTWWNMLARLGLTLPLVAVHDLGLLLASGRRGQSHRLQPAARGSMSTFRT